MPTLGGDSTVTPQSTMQRGPGSAGRSDATNLHPGWTGGIKTCNGSVQRQLLAKSEMEKEGPGTACSQGDGRSGDGPEAAEAGTSPPP